MAGMEILLQGAQALSGLAPALVELAAGERDRINLANRAELRAQIIDSFNQRNTRQDRANALIEQQNQTGQNLSALSGNPNLNFTSNRPRLDLMGTLPVDPFQQVPLDPANDPSVLASFIDRIGAVIPQGAESLAGVAQGGTSSPFGGLFGGAQPGTNPALGGGTGRGPGVGAGFNVPPVSQGSNMPFGGFDIGAFLQTFQGQPPPTNAKSGLPQLQGGTPLVPKQMNVTVDPGEAIIPAGANPANPANALPPVPGGGGTGLGQPAQFNQAFNLSSPGAFQAFNPQAGTPGGGFANQPSRSFAQATNQQKGGGVAEISDQPFQGFDTQPQKPSTGRTTPTTTETTQLPGQGALDRFGPLDQQSQDFLNNLFEQLGVNINTPFDPNVGPIRGTDQINRQAEEGFGFGTDVTPQNMEAIFGGAGQGATLMDQILANPTGFDQATQDAIFNKGQEQIAAQTSALQRQFGDFAATSGRLTTGQADQKARDIAFQGARNTSDLLRDIGIESQQRSFENLRSSFDAESGELGRIFDQNLSAGEFGQGVGQANFENALLQGQSNFDNLFNTVDQNAMLQNQDFTQQLLGNEARNRANQGNLTNQFDLTAFFNDVFNQERDFGQRQVEFNSGSNLTTQQLLDSILAAGAA